MAARFGASFSGIDAAHTLTMDQFLRQILITLRGVWQRRWIGLAVAWLVGIGAGVVIWRIPDQYEASARIYVDTQSVLKPLMAGLVVQPNLEQQVGMLSRRLISRPNVDKLVGMAELDVDLKSKPARDALIEKMLSRLDISTSGKDNIYRLTFYDTDPGRGRRVVESLTTIFLDSLRGEKRMDSAEAKKFIEEQIRAYEVKLSEAEARLKDFRLRHLGLSEGGKDFFGRMDQMGTEVEKARLELREAAHSRDELRRQIAGEEAVLVSPSTETGLRSLTPELDARLDALKRNLDVLLQRFTEDHPDVVGAKRVILQLEEQRRKEIAAKEKIGLPKGASSVSANPVYRELKVSLARAEANVASLQTRVAEYEDRYRQLRDKARSVPQVEAELAQLNRDYDINKKNYEALALRREQAEISGDMESAEGVAAIRVVEPPRVSPWPVAPNRLLLLAGALVAAMGAGAAASFLTSRVWPTFVDGESLREVTELPILGSVSLVEDKSFKIRSRAGLVGFLSGVAALIVAYGAVFAVMFLTMRAA